VNVLLTGSSGHIGSAVAERLIEAGVRVRGLDLRAGHYTTGIGDIADADLVDRLMDGVDAVVHTAAWHAPHVGSVSETQFTRINVDATRGLLAAAASAGIRRFVLTSTTSVYGCTTRTGPPATWATEALVPNPEDVYDVTKLAAEECCREAARGGLTTVVLRVSRCFPEPDPLVAFYRMFRGVDRRDVADAHWLALTTPLGGASIFNISVEPPFQPGDADALWNDPWSVIDRRVTGVRAAFERRGWALPARIDRVYTIDSAKETLGYRPKYGIEEVLGITAS
jgi:nucleoside-diphosphate-sugar epimerase